MYFKTSCSISSVINSFQHRITVLPFLSTGFAPGKNLITFSDLVLTRIIVVYMTNLKHFDYSNIYLHYCFIPLLIKILIQYFLLCHMLLTFLAYMTQVIISS